MHQERASKIAAASVVALSTVFLLSACQQSGGRSESPASQTSATSVGQASVASGSKQLEAYTPDSAYKPLLTCNLGTVNTTTFGVRPVELKADAANTFKGWLFATNLDSPTYWLRFDGQQGDRYLQSPLQLDVERPDVIALHPDAPRVSGFAVTVQANALPPGQYHAYLAVKSDDTTYICDSGRHIDAVH
jgi:hypothetical protein